MIFSGLYMHIANMINNDRITIKSPVLNNYRFNL